MVHQLSQPEIGFVDENRTTVSNDGTSLMSDAEYLANKDIASLDAVLIADSAYTAADVAKMTVNDKQYAVRLLGLTDV
jgi:hypothetical protein